MPKSTASQFKLPQVILNLPQVILKMWQARMHMSSTISQAKSNNRSKIRLIQFEMRPDHSFHLHLKLV